MMGRFASQIQRIEEVILAGAVLVIATLTILNVGCRSLLGFSLAFTEEVSQFCVIAICFVGLSYAAGKARHIRMTAVFEQLPRRLRKPLMVLICVATAALMFALAGYAAVYVSTVYQLGGVYPVLRVPFFAVYAMAPVGLILAGVQYLLAAFKNLTHASVFLAYAVVETTPASPIAAEHPSEVPQDDQHTEKGLVEGDGNSSQGAPQ